MRLGYYAGASTAAAATCLLKAFHQRPNFYSATVYLSQSNACLLILTNLVLVLACTFMFALQRLLYGPLRPIEIEQLSEKAWYAVLDTLLAMPSFREDVGGWLLTMFVLLLAGKVWGWIGEGRVDILEQQPPANPRLFHARLATSLILSVVFDLFMLDYCVETVLADPRPGMMVIFTFEFAVLCVFSVFTLARYGLSLIESVIQKRQLSEAIETKKSEIRAERAAARQNNTADGRPAPASPQNEDPIEVDENEVDVPGWEVKRRYLFILEVVTDFVKLVLYLVFFTVSITFNGLPMHIMRDVYMTFASFSKRVTDYVAYRKATSDMNTRYPDATTEEIRGDSCIVCRENMIAWEQPNAQAPAQPAVGQPAPAVVVPTPRRDEGLRAKKLPCGHILHLRCLKAWLERQQVCPTCRRPVVTAASNAQLGAPGANPAGQAGQQRANRGNRARIFNFGPVRIGFLNGPGDQIQNIVNQMRNPQGQGQNNPPANQQGPNHLGLQVPYLPGAQQGAAPSVGGRASVPTQIQMMQIEQRLLQDAHDLGVEQQQLNILRMMEAELARLRANVMSNQPPIGTNTAAERQAQLVQLPNQHQPQAMDVLRGNTNQQFASGHESLPPGMTLPEGWTVMPLQRVEGQLSQNIPVQPVFPPALQAATVPQASSQPQPYGPPNGTRNEQVQAPQRLEAEVQPSANEHTSTLNGAAGPTDDNGSPLFVPSTSSQSNSSAPAPRNGPTAPPDMQLQQQPPTSQTVWGSDNGWNHIDPPDGSPSASVDARGATVSSARDAVSDGHLGQASSHVDSDGKGKGRAVEVEDAPDTEL